MSASILLYTSYPLNKEELAEIIVQAGGVVTPNGPYFGRVSHDWAHVWLLPIQCYDGVFDYEGNPLDEKEFELTERAKELLGGTFRAWLSLILNSKPGTQKLAVHFAYTFSLHWPCIVDNLEGRLFTGEEIALLEREGGAFRE